MTRTEVCMDNCGFKTRIEAELSDDGKIMLRISSKCKDVQKLAEEFQVVDPMEFLSRKMDKSPVYLAASRCLKHQGCIVAAAIIRTVEVEAGFALPGESTISIKKA